MQGCCYSLHHAWCDVLLVRRDLRAYQAYAMTDEDRAGDRESMQSPKWTFCGSPGGKRDSIPSKPMDFRKSQFNGSVFTGRMTGTPPSFMGKSWKTLRFPVDFPPQDVHLVSSFLELTPLTQLIPQVMAEVHQTSGLCPHV